jgi:hypothetical protein
MKQKVTWYVKPLDSHTNKVIQRELNGAEQVKLKTNLEKPVLAYQVDHAFITRLNDSKYDLHLKYKVYKRQGKDSLANEFSFSFLNKKKKQNKL